MLALLIDWRRRPIDPLITGRMVSSLGAGIGRDARTHAIGPGVFAATLDPAECVAMASGETLLFTGFIQNRAELRAALGVDRCSDAALYAAARERYAEATDHRVIGEYAAITIDPSAALVCQIRAAIQAPPLHCYRSRDQLIVGSTARAIFATGALRARVDEQKIADSLYLNYAEAERDWFVGLTRLPVGCRSLETSKRSSLARYYDLGEMPAVRMKSDGDYIEAGWDLLAQGTRAALDGRTRPAISLSGGLDSQAVAVHAMAAMPVDSSLLGLTGVPEPGWAGDTEPDGFGDESEHVAMLAAQYPELRTETIDAAGRSFDYRLTEMFLHAGGPPRNAMNLHWLHDLHARANSEGCDVLLNGAMGNFSFSFDGSGALASLFARGRWWRLAREVALLPRDTSLIRFFLREALRPNLPRAVDRRLAEWRSPVSAFGLAPWCSLNADYAQQMRVVERANDTSSPRSTREWRLAMLRGAAGEAGDITQALETIHKVPLRDPTAYRPLVEFCLLPVLPSHENFISMTAAGS